MDQDEVPTEDDRLGGTVPHQGHGEWAQAHHYAQGHQDMENVVQIIVPELPCLNQGSSDNLTTALSQEQGVEFVNGNGSAMVAGAAAYRTTPQLRGVKDSLSALAAAAELDQVRNDVLHHVDNIMHDTKYIEISNDKKSSQMLTHIVEKENEAQIFHSCSYESKLPLCRSLPLAPFLNPNDPDVAFYNEIYHYLCSSMYPEGSSEVYKKVIKKRASSYSINDKGSLSYGTKTPKQVVTNVREQKQILESSHVDKETGVHYGVRKMYNLIFGKFYWRSMYVDIGNLVRNCEGCSEATSLSEKSQERGSPSQQDTPVNILPADRIMRVWKKVQVRVYGPYEKTMYGNEFLITMIDPFSGWILARPSPKDCLESICANFIFESFCSFGFAQCQVVSMSSESFEAMQSRYREKFDNAQDILRALVPFDSEDAQHSFMFTLQEKSAECAWAGEMIDDMCINSPENWDEEISRLLFHFCTSKPPNGSASPFSIMFARNPTGYVSEEEKENINILEEEKALEVPSTNRRRLRSSTLQCRHCHETFTSKISFRIHQRKHTEEARRRGTLEGEKRLCNLLLERKNLLRAKRRRRPFGRGPERLLTMATSDWSDQNSEEIPNGIRQHLTQSTVEAVRNLLSATKEERSKRGKYFKYTQELRDEIAQYALDHSIPAATTYWSTRLGNTVSESSIRNFIKNYKCYSADTKEEMGKYAFHNGIEKAVLHFKEKLGFEIRKGIVIKFKKYYMKKIHEGTAGGGGGGVEFAPGESSNGKRNALSTRQKRSFSHQIKDEIGQYASLHSITAAIDHFTVKLQFPVKESTVRKFKRQYIERNTAANASNSVARNDVANEQIGQENALLTEQQQQQQQHQHQQHQGHPSMDLHPLSVLSAPNVSAVNVSAPNNFVYQHPYSLNMSAGGAPSNAAVIPMNHNSLTFHQGSVINQGVASLSYQQTPGAPAVIMNQTFPQVGPPPFQQGYVGSFTPSGSGGNGVGAQGTPLAITHTTVSPSSMAHNNSPLQLTMGGAHLGQINSVSVAQTPHMGAHSLQVPHSTAHQTHTPHQLVASTFHQHVPGSLPFEAVAPLGNHTTVSLNNEPLSLMKEAPQGVEAMPQGEDVSNGTAIQEATVSVSATVNGIPASIIHIPNANISHLEPSHSVQHSQHQHSHHHQQEQHHQHQQHHHQQTQQQQQHQLHEQHETGINDGEEEILGLDEDYSDDPPTPKKKRTKAKSSKYLRSSYTCGKRGNYVSYSPELRAEIGKYAAENGNLATVTYFREKLHIEIPESTVRGLKDKYMIKRMRGEKDVKSLGFAQRGRPMRLGKYDVVVQECIRELLKGGEKVSSFLVIATAKQVLMQYEPSLLEENGGPVKLNPTWAKSFLKRIGLSHLS